MISTTPSGIIAVISGDQQQIIRCQIFQKARQLRIKPFKVASVSSHITPVAVLAIKLDQIGKNECAVLGSARELDKVFHQFCIRPFSAICDATHAENIANFAYCVNRTAFGGGKINQEIFGGKKGKIAAAGRSGEGTGDAYKGTCNHAANTHFVQHRREFGAKVLKPLKAKDFFMRSNLEYAVNGGVANGPASFEVLCPEVIKYACAACVAIG
jgi:hypothetical protein